MKHKRRARIELDTCVLDTNIILALKALLYIPQNFLFQASLDVIFMNFASFSIHEIVTVDLC